MNKYFTIILATVITSLTVTSSAYACVFKNGPFCNNPKPIGGGGGGGCSVSEPAAAMVALTALGLFVAARRRKSV